VIIQAGNALAAALSAALMYAIARRVGASEGAAVCAAGLLALSYGHWYYANGDFQHLSLAVLLVILRALLGEPPTRWGVVGLGALTALAVLFRIENFLFGLVVVTFFLAWRQSGRAVAYALVGAATLLVAVAVLANSPADYFGWFIRYQDTPQEYQGFEAATRVDPLRALKGQLTALTIGVQPLADVARGLVRVDDPPVVLLGAGGLAVLAWLGYGLRWVPAFVWSCARRRLPLTPPGIFAVAMVVWFVPYFALHACFWPTVTKYHIVSLPPLILLALMGSSRIPATLVAVTVLLGVVNLFGAVLPWYDYGREKARVAAALRDAGPALFVSSESGLDRVLKPLGAHFNVKDACIQLPGAACVGMMEGAIRREGLGAGRRVSVYNLVPTPFTLIGINQSPQRRGVPLTLDDFRRAERRLRSTYDLTPVLGYWEEAGAPLYLYGRGPTSTLWEVRPRAAAQAREGGEG
jgi:hypothetical protein